MKKLDRLFVTLSISFSIFLCASCSSCQSKRSATLNIHQEHNYTQVAPMFNEDTAYHFIEKQLSFGPRVPATSSHKNCGDWLATKLIEYDAEVIEQRANIIHYNGQEIELRNIIGSYNPEVEKRILLFAHWDTRPFADNDSNPQRQTEPIMGADDGASGVAVLLEIARQIKLNTPSVGIDIAFFDMEDWGQANFDKEYVHGDWWCVGSRYWSEEPHIENYNPSYGILLDMVGAANATFMHEGYSVQNSPNIISKIWSTAHNLGYKDFFINSFGGYITDDHVPIIENLKIPCVDIINLKSNNTGFAPHWHTHKDNLSIINKGTLKAVGQTVMEVIYKEK